VVDIVEEGFRKWNISLSVSLSLSLSLCGSSVIGTWKGLGLLHWGSRRICKERLWKRASLSLGAPLGTWRVGSFTRDLCVEEGPGNWHLCR